MKTTKSIIPYGKQEISSEDINQVLSVLKSDFLTQGPKLPLFEQKVANYCQARYSVAVNSAASALHIACLALELGKDDWLWTSPNSYVASANCALYCGAKIDFVDIDPETYNLCPIKLEEKLTISKEQGTLPKILVPVHFAGQSCDMEKIFKLSKKFGFKIIEDASHAIGGKFKGEPIGSCKYSDITVFSFHPVKIITTAEGGMATTKSKTLATKMELFRSHGVTRDTDKMEKISFDPWYYEQIDLGYNYRMTEIQAALGISQMTRIDEFISKRHLLKERYNSELKDLPLITPHEDDNCFSSVHLYPIQIHPDFSNKNRREIFKDLRKEGVGVNVHYIPIHTQPYYKNLGFDVGDFPVAEGYYSRALSIPLFHSMTHEQQNEVIKSLKKIIV